MGTIQKILAMPHSLHWYQRKTTKLQQSKKLELTQFEMDSEMWKTNLIIDFDAFTQAEP